MKIITLISPSPVDDGEEEHCFFYSLQNIQYVWEEDI